MSKPSPIAATDTAMVRYELPFPPSTNNLFVNVRRGGRVRSEAYKAWTDIAEWEMARQGRRRILGPVAVSIALVRPDKRRRDASNTIKAVEDLLVSMGVIEADDDRIVQKVSAQWVASGAPCTVLVVEHCGEMAA